MENVNQKHREHPRLAGLHIVRKRLADNTERRYVYQSRGGPSLGVMLPEEDASAFLRRSMKDKRLPFVKAMIKQCEKRAAIKGRPFDLSIEWLQKALHDQGDCCSVSGIPFDYDAPLESVRHPRRPSVDRLDNMQGYTPGNVRLVLSSVNIAINEWGLDHFLALANAVVNHRATKTRP